MNKLAYLRSLMLCSATILFSGVSSAQSWDFVYELKHLNEASAGLYVQSQLNVKKYSEWQSPPFTYWGPTANDVDASITFRFPFEKRTNRIHVFGKLTSYNFGDGKTGQCSLWGSTNGINWIQLLDNPTPISPSSPGGKFYDADLPIGLIGKTELWLQVRFRVSNSPNTTYTLAQFCRNTSDAVTNVFSVHAEYVSSPSIEAYPAMELSIDAPNPAVTYAIQYSSDLAEWIEEERISGSSRRIQKFRSTRSIDKRFWRIVELP